MRRLMAHHYCQYVNAVKTILHSIRNHTSPLEYPHILTNTYVFIQLQYAYESSELTFKTLAIQLHT